MSFDWLNRLVRRVNNGRDLESRSEAVLFTTVGVFLLVIWSMIGFLVLCMVCSAPIFFGSIAIVIGLVYFLSTKIKLRGDGDES